MAFNYLKRRLKSPLFYIGIAFGVITLLLAGKNEFSFLRSTWGTSNSGKGEEAFFAFQGCLLGDHYLIYTMLIPPSIFTWYYLRDKNSGFGNYVISRTGYKRYFRNICVSEAILTGIMEIAPLIIVFVYCAFRYGTRSTAEDFLSVGEEGLFYIHPWIWTVGTILLHGILSILISFITLGLSNYIRRYYLAVIATPLWVLANIVVVSMLYSILMKLGISNGILLVLTPLYFCSLDQMSVAITCWILYGILAGVSLACLYNNDKREYIA